MLSMRAKIIATAALIVVILLAKAGYAQIVYSDWTCAFANCVKVQEAAR
jgi:hypothetical protein